VWLLFYSVVILVTPAFKTSCNIDVATTPKFRRQRPIHYLWLYKGPNNWLVLVLIMLAGALIRHSFVTRHRALVLGESVKWWHDIAGGLIVLGLIVGLEPKRANH
jgi:uncharacterized membrane protein